jgi:spore maturation protein CgeB
LTDTLFSYSKASLKVFRMMGAAGTEWLPFAGDISAHYRQAAEQEAYKWDLSFIGSWRPEREKALEVLHKALPTLRLRVSGPYWNRCSYQPIKKMAVSKPLYGKDLADVVASSFLNLNVMDDTNYPASNMRFFEIITAGGMEICSSSPEMEDIFRQREHVLYFSDEKQLVDQVHFAMQNRQLIEKIKLNGQQLLMESHLYKHRAQAILNVL